MGKGMKNFLIICGIIICVGLILSVTGMTLGGIRGLSGVEEKVPWISFGGGGAEGHNFSDLQFDSADIQGDNIEFVESDRFEVTTKYDKKTGAPQVAVKNGTLTIKSSSTRQKQLSLNIFPDRNYENTEITVYYPKKMVFNEVKLQNDMGDINLGKIRAKKVDVESTTGNIRVSHIKADQLILSCDMGDIRGSDLDVKGTTVSCNAGNVALSGSLAGITKAECDMGNCTLKTTLPKSSYAIRTEIDLGSCQINGKQVGNTYQQENQSAENHINLNCSAGDALIEFL